MHISYNDSFATDLFAKWETIMTEWDDRKSHEINDKYIHVLQQACKNLVDLARTTQVEIERIANESDSIY